MRDLFGEVEERRRFRFDDVPGDAAGISMAIGIPLDKSFSHFGTSS